MKPMLYQTQHGFAEVTGYDGYGKEIDGYRIVYDSKAIPTETLKDDGAFASWVYKNGARYLGSYYKHERPAII
jgi:hypothetical protein